MRRAAAGPAAEEAVRRPAAPSDSSAGRRAAIAAVAGVVVFVGFAAAYRHIAPLGEQPDELSHLQYALLIAHHHVLPGVGVPERQQPPLYYAMVAAVLRLSGDDLTAARWLSIGLSVTALVLVALTARELFGDRPWMAPAAVACIALLPGWQFEAAQVSNDPLAWCTGALAIWLMVRTLRAPGFDTRMAAAVGTAIGLCLLAKVTAWAVAAVLLVAVLWRHRGRLRPRAWAVLLLTPTAMAGWWFVRAQVVFGRPLPPVNPVTPNPQHVRTVHQLASWLSLLWKSVVGVEAPTETPLVVGPGRLTLVLLVGAGVMVGALLAVALRRAWPLWDGERRALAAWLAVPPVVLFALTLLNSVFIDDQPQGRYLLVAAPAFGCAAAWLAARTLGGLTGPRFGLAVGTLVAGALALDIASLHTLHGAIG